MPGTSAYGSSCGACKFLRRKCARDCVFAPHFSYEEAASHFAAVHRVFGASNVSKLLSRLPGNSRSEAVATIAFEALARVRDPVHGCVAHIIALQQQVAYLQEEIGEVLGKQMVMGSTNLEVSKGNHPEISNPRGLQGGCALEQALLLPQTAIIEDAHVDNLSLNGHFPSGEGVMSQNPVWGSDLTMAPLEGLVPGGLLAQNNLSHYPWLLDNSGSL